MMRSLEDVMAGLPPKRRARVEAKAKRLIRAETLRQLRAAARKTQQEVASATGIAQHNVSRLERRGDMLLSTLQTYVDGLGGRLRLVAEFPSIDPVELDFSGRPVSVKSRQKRRRAASVKTTAS
jgi:transcriptional regulator with XRE-family HTH domain